MLNVPVLSFKPKRPTLIWDGDCGFCKYWVLRMQAHRSPIEYTPYQEIHEHVTDLDMSDFKKKAWLIESGGQAFSGAGSIYRVLWHQGSTIPFFLYQHVAGFRKLSDEAYQLIADHRPFMFKITRWLWGSNPKDPKKYWIAYLILGLVVIIGASLKAGKRD